MKIHRSRIPDARASAHAGVFVAALAFVSASAAAVTPAHRLTHPGGHAPAPAGAAHGAGATTVATTPKRDADSTMTLHGGEDGTVFRTLTVEGEDRIHFDVERPTLKLDLDPAKAPGLDWGSASDVLDRTTPDLVTPLLAVSTAERSPYVGRPWLSHFASGAVARFRPDVKGVERWKLSVANARGETVTTFEGRGDPPQEIAWNGLSSTGEPVLPGLTYSYVFEAHDRAGNKRNFVGEGFEVAAWRLQTPAGPVLAFSGAELRAGASASRTAGADATPPVVLEAASWLDQSERVAQPLKISASARSAEAANELGTSVARWLGPLLVGGPARLQVVPEVRSDAPESGAVRIAAAK
jgi:hypothetical protein